MATTSTGLSESAQEKVLSRATGPSADRRCSVKLKLGSQGLGKTAVQVRHYALLCSRRIRLVRMDRPVLLCTDKARHPHPSPLRGCRGCHVATALLQAAIAAVLAVNLYNPTFLLAAAAKITQEHKGAWLAERP